MEAAESSPNSAGAMKRVRSSVPTRLRRRVETPVAMFQAALRAARSPTDGAGAEGPFALTLRVYPSCERFSIEMRGGTQGWRRACRPCLQLTNDEDAAFVRLL